MIALLLRSVRKMNKIWCYLALTAIAGLVAPVHSSVVFFVNTTKPTAGKDMAYLVDTYYCSDWTEGCSVLLCNFGTYIGLPRFGVKISTTLANQTTMIDRVGLKPNDPINCVNQNIWKVWPYYGDTNVGGYVQYIDRYAPFYCGGAGPFSCRNLHNMTLYHLNLQGGLEHFLPNIFWFEKVEYQSLPTYAPDGTVVIPPPTGVASAAKRSIQTPLRAIAGSIGSALRSLSDLLSE